MTQLKLNFSGKKTERITFAATEDLKDTLDKLQKKLNRESVSELIQEYVIECAMRDMARIHLLEHRGEKRMADLL
jgi:hypothetical protein